jgi:cyanophycinase
MGIVALMGGDEFGNACVPMDKALLALLGIWCPSVVILPTAAAFERPELAAQHGVDYFQDLETRPRVVMVLSRTEANDPAVISPIETADVVYLTGGNPAYLLETLRDTSVWQAIRTCLDRGGMVIGSSAGAMVLGNRMRTGAGRWENGLGLASGVAVLPHHPKCPAASQHVARHGLPDEIVLLGIPTATAAYSNDGLQWQVVGEAPVTVYTPNGVVTQDSGSTFAISITS